MSGLAIVKTELDPGVGRVMPCPPTDVKSVLPHFLIEGDALQRSTLKRDTVDLVVTSPPYNIGKAYTGDGGDDEKTYDDYLKFSQKWLECLAKSPMAMLLA